LINLRAADYVMVRTPRDDGGHSYSYNGPNGQAYREIITKNYLTTINQDYMGETFPRESVVMVKTQPPPFPHKEIKGHEDVRLVWNDVDKTLWITFTSFVSRFMNASRSLLNLFLTHQKLSLISMFILKSRFLTTLKFRFLGIQ
jgi:hypothetical protein